MATTTPAGVTLTATKADGATIDATEAVQVLYDLVIQSMDWGSGFLTVEDVEPIVGLAEFCGFKGDDSPREYVEREREAERQRNCTHPEWRESAPDERRTIWNVCQSCGARRFVRTA